MFFSPFSKVPGPLFAKLTTNWLLVRDLAGNRARTVHKLHQKFGSAVQIEPNEISFSGLDEVDKLYGFHSDYRKAPVYSTIGRHGIFNIQDPVEHRQRRKQLSHVF